MKQLTALVTGANKSLGLETARLLAAAGYHVFSGSRDRIRGEEAVAKLRSAGFDGVETVVIDVTRDESVRAAFAEVAARVTQLDVLVNNAGIPGQFQMQPSNVDEDNLKKVFETNLFGPIRMVRVFMPLLRAS